MAELISALTRDADGISGTEAERSAAATQKGAPERLQLIFRCAEEKRAPNFAHSNPHGCADRCAQA